MTDAIYRWIVVALLTAILIVNYASSPHRGAPLRVTGDVDVTGSVRVDSEPLDVTIKNEEPVPVIVKQD